ncbi:EAL domain-containing protein, partial [Roseivivax sp. CAU 1761]
RRLPAALFAARAEAELRAARAAGDALVCLILSAQFAPSGAPGAPASGAAARLRARLHGVLDDGDVLQHLGPGRFGVLMRCGADPGPETLLPLAARLRAALDRPLRRRADAPLQAACCGLAAGAPGDPELAGAELVARAAAALEAAQAAGGSALPGATRLWAPPPAGAPARPAAGDDGLARDLPRALATGQIRPWFQPQICTSTGKITGVEALARWHHPDRGVLAPGRFLPLLAAGGHMPAFGAAIRAGAFEALQLWDAAGIAIPRLGLNFAEEELRDPALPNLLQWELDRHDLGPERIGIEILETVFTSGDGDPVGRNVAALQALGCRIDLDDFGTGHSSILTLHRLPVDRVKIDRGFVTGLDRAERQRRMVQGILSLAGQLGVATLAEGVETPGEHALLAQLGCDHVQGFGIARPMPAAELIGWARRHAAGLAETGPALTRRVR